MEGDRNIVTMTNRSRGVQVGSTKLPPGVKLSSTIRLGRQPITSIVFISTDGTLAFGTGSGTIRLWNPESRKQLGSLRGHTSPVLSVAFDPASGILASGS